MSGTTHDEEQRHDKRAERLRREAARRRRQLVAVPVVLIVLVALVAALAWRPAASSGAGPARSASVAATSVPTQAGEPTASVEPTGSAAATGSADASRSAESTTGAGASKVATGAATIAAIKPLRPAPGVKTIVVDKSEQRVTLYTAKGTPVDTFRCASGITYPRIGTYHVYGHRKQSWSMYDASTFYYFTMFVKSDKGNNIGFHSIPTIDGKLVGKLGVPVSHGCVRLDKAKAKFVYSWAPVGTKVVVKR